MSFRKLFSCVAPLLLAGWALFAQSPASGGATIQLNPDEVREQLSTREELVDVNNETTVARHLQAIAAAPADDQGGMVQDLSQYLVEHGLTPAPDVAEAFLSLAEQAGQRGNSEDFQRLVSYAQSFAPGHPAIHMALAAEARKRQGTFSITALYESLAALLSAFAAPSWRPVALADLALWSRIASLLLLAAMALLLLFRYQSTLRHDVQEWLGSTEVAWTRAAGWIVLFAPSLLLLSGYWWIVYWAAVFLLYATWSERIATLLGVALLLASGWFTLWAEQGLYVAQSQPHWSNLRCYDNRMDTGPDRELAADNFGGESQSALNKMILANRFLLQGSYIRAEKLYKEVDREVGGDAQARNNLGCIYYYQMRPQEAIQQFTSAVELRPDTAEAYFNRALAKNKLFDYTGADEDQNKARSLNPALVQRLGQEQEEWVPLLIFPSLEKTHATGLKQATRRPTGLSSALASRVSVVSGLLQPPYGFIAFLLSAGFLGMAVAKKRNFFSRACFKCGRPYCPQCKTSLEFESFCGQCVHLYIKQDGVSPEARLKKNYEVERYNRFQGTARAVLSLLAPGAGHVWEGKPIQGVLILGLWCMLLSGFLIRGWAYPFPSTAGGGLFPAFALVASVLMGVIWIVFGLLKALSHPAPAWADPRARR